MSKVELLKKLEREYESLRKREQEYRKSVFSKMSHEEYERMKKLHASMHADTLEKYIAVNNLKKEIIDGYATLEDEVEKLKQKFIDNQYKIENESSLHIEELRYIIKAKDSEMQVKNEEVNRLKQREKQLEFALEVKNRTIQELKVDLANCKQSSTTNENQMDIPLELVKFAMTQAHPDKPNGSHKRFIEYRKIYEKLKAKAK